MKTYRIAPGASFRADDNSIKTSGELIEIADDVYPGVAHMLEPLPVDNTQQPRAEPEGQ